MACIIAVDHWKIQSSMNVHVNLALHTNGAVKRPTLQLTTDAQSSVFIKTIHHNHISYELVLSYVMIRLQDSRASIWFVHNVDHSTSFTSLTKYNFFGYVQYTVMRSSASFSPEFRYHGNSSLIEHWTNFSSRPLNSTPCKTNLFISQSTALPIYRRYMRCQFNESTDPFCFCPFFFLIHIWV